MAFVEIGEEAYERKHRDREITALRKKAAKLGFALNQLDPSQSAA